MNKSIEYDIKSLDVIQQRRNEKDNYTNPHTKLTGITVSETESRKQLKGIENYLLYKEEILESECIQEEEIPRYKETVELCANGDYKSDKLIKMNSEQSKDRDYLLKAHGFDSGFWEITSARNNMWNSYSKKDGVMELYSSKITVKPIIPEFKVEWINEAIASVDYKNCILPKMNHEDKKDGVTVEINFCDVHLGKYVTALVANGNYNSDIAINVFKKAIDKAILATNHYDIKKIIFVMGQDYLNFDNLQGTTTKGTRQDMNEFFHEVYNKGLKLLIETIEILRQIAPTEVIYVKGNHDKLTSYTMAKTLDELYKFNSIENVTVDYSPKQRKYRVYGDSLVGYGHGEEEKNRIFDCMQVDEKENWSKKYKYFHLSHKHSEKGKEKAGVEYNWLGCLSESCKWTWDSGFVGAVKKGHVFVYDDIDGKIAQFYIKVS